MIYTESSGFNKAITEEDLLKALEHLQNIEKEESTEWILINPQGQMYKATPEKLLPLLMKYHPLLKKV